MINLLSSQNNIHFGHINNIPSKNYTIVTIKNAEESRSYYNNYCLNSFVETTPEIEYSGFGYKVSNKSKQMKEFDNETSSGFSTPAEIGGTWLKGNTNTPLSTKGVHDCAVLNLVNENNDSQMLYHISPKSETEDIVDLIKKEFPRFTKANIMLGDVFDTKKTFNKALSALDEINPKAEKNYYHALADNPEVVAVDGELQYIKNPSKHDMSFKTQTNLFY